MCAATGGHTARVAKYDVLLNYLCGDQPAVRMTFQQVADLVGGLPDSAYRHRAWWENEAESGKHVQARSWLAAEREVERVDLTAEVVVFSAPQWNRGS